MDALLGLMEDTETMARDWATTAIGGTLALDGPHIRDALLRRSGDNDAIVRAEALHGLARRGDHRAVPLLIKELISESDYAHLFEEAAKCLVGLDEDAKDSEEEIVAALQTLLAESSS
jgi:HEAT repeat protein